MTWAPAAATSTPAAGWDPARCHDGDRALAVVATENGTRRGAGRRRVKYYRGDAGETGSRSPDHVDEGDRIVAQNGAWKYQMSPDGLLITENNVVKQTQDATVWGRA